MAEQFRGMFSPVLKKFPGAWSLCPYANATVHEINETVRVKVLRKPLQNCVKVGWCSPDLFWPLPSAISVNSNAGVGAGRE